MNTRHFLCGALVALALGTVPTHAAAPKSTTMKCWTNREGVRECGNQVPPEYAQQKTRTLSKSGMVLEEKQRARPAAAVKPTSVAEPQEDPDERRVREEQEKYDRALLATFTTEQDLIRTRDRQLAAFADQVEYTRMNVDKLKGKAAQYRKRIEEQERKGKTSADDQKNLDTVQKQIEKKQAFIAAKTDEIESLRAKYDRDLLRFRELTQQSAQ